MSKKYLILMICGLTLFSTQKIDRHGETPGSYRNLAGQEQPVAFTSAPALKKSSHHCSVLGLTRHRALKQAAVCEKH